MSNSLFDPLARAIIFATEAHDDQYDKSAQPYILHCLRVMLRGRTQEERIVGVLHDVVEDCNVEVTDIWDDFGPEIGAAVDAISRRGDEPYAQYTARCIANPLARRVKIADLEDNLDPKRITLANHKEISRDRYAKLYAELKAEEHP